MGGQVLRVYTRPINPDHRAGTSPSPLRRSAVAFAEPCAGIRLVPTICSYKLVLRRGIRMKTVSVRQLKNNPSVALRQARERPVMVLNRHQPEALLVHLDDDSLLTEPGIRLALATALFREQSLSLGQAARFSGAAPAEFIRHVSRLGIPVVRGTAATVHEDTEAIAAWRNGSSPRTRAR